MLPMGTVGLVVTVLALESRDDRENTIDSA